MTRVTFTGVDCQGGCVACVGLRSKPLWISRNAMALAARHHDATGHQTWCEQVLSVTYGDADISGGGGQLSLFPEPEVTGG
jgi:hypothetical protein